MERSSFETFWNQSSELANEAVRQNFIGINAKETDGDLFDPIYKYYQEEMSLMERQMFKSVTKRDFKCYRNVVFDVYNSKNIGDDFLESSFVSCFIDNFDLKYGSVQLEIIVPKGTPYLHSDNIVILPSGIYRLEACETEFYVIKMIKAKNIF